MSNNFDLSEKKTLTQAYIREMDLALYGQISDQYVEATYEIVKQLALKAREEKKHCHSCRISKRKC